MDEPIVADIVTRDDRPPPGDGRRVDPPVHRLADGGARTRRSERPVAGHVGLSDQASGGFDEIELGSFRIEEPARRVDDLVEEVARVADRGDPGGDLAERLFGASPPSRLLARAGQCLDQPGIVDGDRGLVSEGLDEGDLVGIERAGFRPADLEHAEEPVLAPQRRDDE
jgi:hypothetical protein